MKINLLLLAVVLLSGATFSQDVLTLKIKNTSGQPVPNVEVTAFNEAANDLVKGRTNATGTVVMTLTKNGVYSLSYLEMKDFDSYEVKEGFTGTFSQTVTYDPKKIFVPKPKADRSGIAFTTVNSLQLRGKPGVITMNILVKKTDMTLVPFTEVIAVSVPTKTKYTAKTDAKGSAIFYLPKNARYEMDVDGNEAIKTIDVPNEEGIEMTQVIFYEKAVLAEVNKGDTIIQKNITQTNGTNTHLLFTMKLRDYSGSPLPNEPVYLQAEGQKRVYEGLTDKNGECKMMIQKNANYIVNLKYEQGLHLVEAKNQTGFGQETITRRYRGSKEIERILAEQLAEMKRLEEEEKLLQQRRIEEARIRKLQEAEREKAEMALRLEKMRTEKELVMNFYNKKFVPKFNTTPVQAASAPTNYLTKTPEGFNVEFNSSGPIGTPTVINDKMFLPAGFYSPDFYCLKAETGQYLWGVELGESGASPAVYHNGVILINTYSCTLYAIDAVTGKLLWSKWLAGTVYSTPTADGDNVYVVYHYGGAYVLTCFDLRSGDFKWINRVDSETLACPVVDGNEVHVASQTGFYYIFDKITGKPIDVITDIHAVSSPTLTAQSIFLTAKINGKEQLIELDRITHKLKKTYKTEVSAIAIRDNHECSEQMNFNGSRPIVYQNKYVVLADMEKLRVFDAQSEQMLWEQPISINSSQVPIVANNQIVLATTTGELMSFDIITGKPKQLRKYSKPIDAQPVFNKGLLYVASSGLLTVIRSVQNFQWNQWNKDAGHNLNLK
jgi:outer membrane protein assembly factor BamB